MIMECPRTHEWYELERGDLSREHAERLRRHIAECPSCRHQAEGNRSVAAALESLAGCTRGMLSEEAGEAVLRRGRVHGLVGRGYRRPLTVRLVRSRWVRLGLPLAAAAAGAILIVIGLQLTASVDVTPRGALERLARSSSQVTRASELRRLVPLVRAAVSEEMARPDPSSDQVGDLLLASYIGRRPREDRQVSDFRFLVAGAEARRHAQLPVATASRPAWPMLASIVLAQAVTPVATGAAGTSSLPAVARSRMLSGDYAGALAVLPPTEEASVLRAWCLESIGRPAEATRVLANAQGTLPMVLRADLALSGQDIAETLRQYEMLAAGNDRYWFAAGYVCRYELADASAAGVRFQRVRESSLRDYTCRTFQGELMAAGSGGPERLFAADFDNWNTGAPAEMTLVRVHGGEFRVVEAVRGRALEQNEISYRGAEFLVGEDDWSDYTLQFDVRVLESQGNYAVGAAAYRRADQTGYVLELSTGRVRLVKQLVTLEAAKKRGSGLPERMRLEPVQAEVCLEEPPARGWWYTMKIRVQHVPGGVSVAGKFWRSDTEEPLTPQVVWTDSGGAGAGPLLGGVAGVQVSGARVQVDNFVITRNESVGDLLQR
jgi:hypothetical protein